MSVVAADRANPSASYSRFFLLIAAGVYTCSCFYWLFAAPVKDLSLAANIGNDENFFSYDLLNFVTAFRLLAQGDNPYSAELQNKLLELAQGFEYPHPLNFLYAPITLIIFSPLLCLPLEVLRIAWLLLSILAMVSAVDILMPSESSRKCRLVVIVTAASFAPFLSSLYWGQLTPFVILALALAIRAVNNERWVTAGFFFACCTIKPQIWFLAAVGLAIWSIRFRKVLLVGSFIIFTLLLCVLAEWAYSGIHFAWFANMSFVTKHAGVSLTPTFSGITRLVLLRFGYSSTAWLSNLSALIAAIGFSILVFKKSNWSFNYIFALGLLLSAILSPYSWFHDQSAIILAFALLFYGENLEFAYRKLVILLLFSVITTLASQYLISSQHQLICFSVACILLFLSKIGAQRRVKTTRS